MDCSTKFVNQSLITWCDLQGICLQLTAPYSPAQNSVMECYDLSDCR
jgi:hypothetical protein